MNHFRWIIIFRSSYVINNTNLLYFTMNVCFQSVSVQSFVSFCIIWICRTYYYLFIRLCLLCSRLINKNNAISQRQLTDGTWPLFQRSSSVFIVRRIGHLISRWQLQLSSIRRVATIKSRVPYSVAQLFCFPTPTRALHLRFPICRFRRLWLPHNARSIFSTFVAQKLLHFTYIV